MCILFTGEIVRALRFKSSQAFLKRPPVGMFFVKAIVRALKFDDIANTIGDSTFWDLGKK